MGLPRGHLDRAVPDGVEVVDLEAGHQLREALAGDAQLARSAGDAAVANQDVGNHSAFEILAASASVGCRASQGVSLHPSTEPAAMTMLLDTNVVPS